MNIHSFFRRFASAWRELVRADDAQATDDARIVAVMRVWSQNVSEHTRILEEAVGHHEDWHSALDRHDAGAARLCNDRLQAALKRAGVSADRLDSEVLDAAWELCEAVERGAKTAIALEHAVECVRQNALRGPVHIR